MNIAQAKQIPLEAVLQAIKAVETKAKADRSEIWYLSPRRKEETASFKIDTKKNLWYDHGDGVGGDIIKLVQEHTGGTVSEALQWLKNISGNTPPQTQQQRTASQRRPNKEPSTPVYELVKEKQLTNRTLIEYAKGRGIPFEVAEQHFREVHFRSSKSKKQLYGLGLQNDGGGWAIRSALEDFHAVIAPNGITTQYSQEEAHTLDVFEGGFDFVTKEQLVPAGKNGAAMILNSASFADSGIQKILTDSKFQHLQLIRTWFDNDKRGEEITQAFAVALHMKCDVGDMRESYAGFKDLNKWLTDCPNARNQYKKAEFRAYYEPWGRGQATAKPTL